MKKLLDLLRLPASVPTQPKRETGSTARPAADKAQADTNAEVTPGRLFDHYRRVLYRPGELTDKLK